MFSKGHLCWLFWPHYNLTGSRWKTPKHKTFPKAAELTNYKAHFCWWYWSGSLVPSISWTGHWMTQTQRPSRHDQSLFLPLPVSRWWLSTATSANRPGERQQLQGQADTPSCRRGQLIFGVGRFHLPDLKKRLDLHNTHTTKGHVQWVSIAHDPCTSVPAQCCPWARLLVQTLINISMLICSRV